MDHPQAVAGNLPTSTPALGAGTRFGLLGALTVQDAGGVELPVSTPKCRTLLAMLLLQPNRVVSRGRLQAALWGERPPASAAASLNNHVVRLRRLLGAQGAERLRTVPPGYLLQVGRGELDSDVFAERLRAARGALLEHDWHRVSREATAALALWRGTPLHDLPSLADEALPHLRQWQEARLEASQWRFQAELHLGRHQGLIPELTRWAGEYPLREAFHHQLMTALDRAGQRAEALAVYRRLRRTLIDELGIEPGAAVQETHQEILRADGAGQAPPGPARPASPDRAAMTSAALPRDVASFTGRGDELRHLLETCRSRVADGGGVVGIHAVDGMPGVGKSAFAIHAAHRLIADFPDGQIFLPLHAHTPGTPAVEPADALVTLLLAVGVAPQEIPQGLSARAGLWRTRLVGRRMLLVLDDARSSEQVDPLLPGASQSLVLVTSRRRLVTLDDALPITLNVLPPSEAAELFVAKAGRVGLPPSDDEVIEVVRLCGHLPLAIQLTAARLRHHPAWAVADLLPDLRAATGRLTALHAGEVSVAAAFDLSYRALTPDPQRLFRRLGLHPGDDIDAYAAAALAGTDLATTRRLLEALEDHHLIDEQVRGRYRMHDLIREHARTLATAEEPAAREAALDRLLDYYLHTATTADRHHARLTPTRRARLTAPPAATPDLSTVERASAWLRAERANLHAAVEFAAGHARPSHAVQLPSVMHDFLRTQGHWNQALALHAIALDTARLTGDPGAQANALADLGVAEQLNGGYGEAADHLHRALEIFRDLRDLRGQANVLTSLGELQRMTAPNTEAAESQRQALELFRTLGDHLGEAHALLERGLLRQRTGEYAAAAADLTQAMELNRALGNRLGEANALVNLGEVQQAMGEYEAAVDSQRQAWALFHGLGSRLGEANALANLGEVQQAVGEYAAAADSQRQALALCRTLGSRLSEANVLANLGEVQQAMGEYEAAAGTLQEALTLCRELGTRVGQAHVLTALGEVQQATGGYEAAAASLRRAWALFRDLEDRGGEARVLNMLGRLMSRSSTAAQARTHHARALELARAIDSPFQQARALEGIGDSHCREGHGDQGAVHLRQALAIDLRLAVPDAERVRAALAALSTPGGSGNGEFSP